MKITPLTILAAARIPALTDTFSDRLAVSSLAVTDGGQSVITTTAPHGRPVGTELAVSVIDAITPNPIAAIAVLGNGDVRITTTYPHVLSSTPDATKFQAWDGSARIAGTGIAGLDGDRLLVSVENNTTLTIRPGGSITAPAPIPSGAAVMERLEREILGYHKVTATGASTLSFPTPAAVTRSYVITAPNIVTNVRVAAVVDVTQVLRLYTRSDESDAPTLDRGWLLIAPKRRATLSRDRSARTDAITELTPDVFVRQMLQDGFEIYVVLPAERFGGGAGCIDRANGSVLTAILRTFNGLKLPFTELTAPNAFIAQLVSHGVETYNKANYVHSYQFDVTAYLTNGDSVRAWEVPDLTPLDQAVQDGDPLPGSVPINGTVPIVNIDFAPEPEFGIYSEDHPQPLTANVKLR